MKTPEIKLLHSLILLRQVEAEQKVGSIIIPEHAREKPHEGVVVAVGPGLYTKDGQRVPVPVSVGDRVLYSAWSGQKLKLDGEEYLMVQENDVIGILQ